MFTPTDPPSVTVKMRVPNKIADRLEIAARVITLAYTAFMAWQVAKVVCPPLAVHERLFVERLQKRLAKPSGQVTQQQADDFVADVTKWVRTHGEG